MLEEFIRDRDAPFLAERHHVFEATLVRRCHPIDCRHRDACGKHLHLEPHTDTGGVIVVAMRTVIPRRRKRLPISIRDEAGPSPRLLHKLGDRRRERTGLAIHVAADIALSGFSDGLRTDIPQDCRVCFQERFAVRRRLLREGVQHGGDRQKCFLIHCYRFR